MRIGCERRGLCIEPTAQREDHSATEIMAR